MNYDQVLDFMFSQLPMFHRIGAPAYKADLNNTIALSELTGFPYHRFKTIHVAGTNGKGSVSHMLSSILQEAGLKTGLFTSPHLVDFRERIKVNGEMISKEFVTDFIVQYTNDFGRIKPSFFEMTFALGMSYFADMKVDIAVIETGMGGRLDSTNVITPELSIITNIGFDHMQFLGNTLEEIAGEKAGIIKPGVPVVIGESNIITDDVFLKKAQQFDNQIIFADRVIQLKSLESSKSDLNSWLIATAEYDTDDLNLKEYNGLPVDSPLTGDYQKYNIATVIAAAGFLRNVIAKKHLIAGIGKTITNTNLQGRWQTLSYQPLTICDIGHNTHGLKYVVSQIKKQNYKQLHFILGAVNDKDITNMLAMLPKDACYYFCRPDIPRGLDSSVLCKLALEAGLQGIDCNTVAYAFKEAMQGAEKEDMIFIGGSTFVVAEAIPLFSPR
jgi:dihydrofolate synthase / folylpolyglutamate synthase